MFFTSIPTLPLGRVTRKSGVAETVAFLRSSNVKPNCASNDSTRPSISLPIPTGSLDLLGRRSKYRTRTATAKKPPITARSVGSSNISEVN